MQRFGAFRQFGEVAFLEGFGERIEQAPDVPTFKGIMTRLAPLMQHGWDKTVAANADIRSTDYEVVGLSVADLSLFIGGDALVLVMPFRHEFSDGPSHHLGKVTVDEPGVLACEFDLAAKAQIVTNKYCSPGHDTGGECLVVTVAQAEHPAVVVAGSLSVDFHETKVALSFVRQRMGLRADAQVGGGKSFLNGGDQLMMRNRTPARGGAWCPHFVHFGKIYALCAAVENKIGMPGRGAERLRFEICNHNCGKDIRLRASGKETLDSLDERYSELLCRQFAGAGPVAITGHLPPLDFDSAERGDDDGTPGPLVPVEDNGRDAFHKTKGARRAYFSMPGSLSLCGGLQLQALQ